MKRLAVMKPSYGSVMATLALFISLGGASYAAISLPPNSVGSRQLRRASVSREALGFPLGIWSVLDETSTNIEKGPCDSPRQQGGINVLCRAPSFVGVAGSKRTLHVHLATAGYIALSGVVAAENQAASSLPPATLILQAEADGRPISRTYQTIDAASSAQVPLEYTLRLGPGNHRIELALGAHYVTSEPGDIVVTSSTFVAMVLPHS